MNQIVPFKNNNNSNNNNRSSSSSVLASLKRVRENKVIS